MTKLWEYQNDLCKRSDEGSRFFKECFVDEVYKQALKEKDIVIDIGACYGEFSAYIYNQAQTIYAIEAHKPTFDQLVKYKEDYELDKILPFNYAMGSINGKRYLQEKGVGGHVILNEFSPIIDTIEIEGKTLYTLMQENNIKHVDILKIDTEGSENEIINSEDFKLIAPDIDLIIGEHSFEQIKTSLNKLGFDVTAVIPGFVARKHGND